MQDPRGDAGPAREECYELSDAELEAVSGGKSWVCTDDDLYCNNYFCPNY